MTVDRPGSFDGLPEVLREIAEVAGIDVAMKLVWAYGGNIVHIPQRAPPKHWLVECVGRAAAHKICDHYRIINADGRAVGLRLQIPIAGTSTMAQAKRKLAKLLQDGQVTVPRAARLCGVHERTAWRLKAGLQHSGDDAQGDLFD